MTPKHQRMLIVGCAILMMAVAAGFILRQFSEQLIYFYTPSMLDAKQREPGFDGQRPFRLGGMVKAGSIRSLHPGLLQFTVTDGVHDYDVQYAGLPPALFREGQGVVMLGTLRAPGRVSAQDILAKHDETYMPPEVANALRDSGHWGGDGGNYPRAH